MLETIFFSSERVGVAGDTAKELVHPRRVLKSLKGILASRRIFVEDPFRLLELFIEQTVICTNHTRTAFSIQDFKRLDKLQVFFCLLAKGNV